MPGKELDHPRLPLAFSSRVVNKWIVKPVLTVFLGFKEFSPGFRSALRALGRLAVIQPFDSPEIQNATLKHCSEFPDELAFAARRARYLFEKEKSRSIGIFVPELGENFSLVERALASVFFPPAAFHINSGKPLFNHPLVASALSLLELAKPRINHANAGAILRSPFINGAASERSLRALADLDLRKRRELDVSLRDLTHASKHCPELLQLWSSLGAS